MDEDIGVVPEYKVRRKRNVLAGVLVLVVVSVVAEWIAAGSLTAFQLIAILTAVGYTVGIILWCSLDAAERGIELKAPFRIAVLLLGPLALMYYMFKSRGFLQGLISILWAAGFFLLMLVTSTVVNFGLALISDRMHLFRK